MKTCMEIRSENLKELEKQVGGRKNLADKTGKSEIQISQWINQSKDSKTGKPRGMSDDIAREIEEKCGKERGWLDNDHSDPALELYRSLPPDVRAWLMRTSNSGNEPPKKEGNGNQ
jgi:hypothetical protein